MNNRGLSNLVAYVLLITIAIVIAIFIYGWLKFYVQEDSVAICPDSVNTVIQSYECVEGTDGYLSVTLKNKGLFTSEGFILRVHDRIEADFGIYVFDDVGKSLAPGENYTVVYNFSDYTEKIINDVTFVDVQPFVDDGEKVSCQAYAAQRVFCSSCGNGRIDPAELCDDGNNVNGDGCNALCITEFVYDGFSDGETFAEYDDGPNGPIDSYFVPGVSGARCFDPSVGNNCYLFNYPSTLTLSTPYIPVAGRYLITYDVGLGGIPQVNEDYSVSCGGVTNDFFDGVGSGVNSSFYGHLNMSLFCDFAIGENEIIFSALPSAGTDQSMHFYYLKIEGPVV